MCLSSKKSEDAYQNIDLFTFLPINELKLQLKAWHLNVKFEGMIKEII